MRHFGSVHRECLLALRHALPTADEAALTAGFRNCRLLLEHDALARCKAGGKAPTVVANFEQLIAFLAGGLRALAPPPTAKAKPRTERPLPPQAVEARLRARRSGAGRIGQFRVDVARHDHDARSPARGPGLAGMRPRRVASVSRPWTRASTEPSRRLRTHPTTPASPAVRRTQSRYPTPCTVPSIRTRMLRASRQSSANASRAPRWSSHRSAGRSSCAA